MYIADGWLLLQITGWYFIKLRISFVNEFFWGGGGRHYLVEQMALDNNYENNHNNEFHVRFETFSDLDRDLYKPDFL